MSQEIIENIQAIEKEKGIEEGVLVTALEDALRAAYKKTPGATRHAEVKLDGQGDFCVFGIEIPEDIETRLVEARLQTLQRQLQPHFLFNTLNTISALMHRDVEAADAMIARLSDLLRMSLQMVGVQEVPLTQELDFLSKYLEIEQTRFRDRLTVVFDVQPDTFDALVPNLILQPLVENAIKHGIGPRPSPGTITIRSRRVGGLLDQGQAHRAGGDQDRAGARLGRLPCRGARLPYAAAEHGLRGRRRQYRLRRRRPRAGPQARQ